MQLDLPKHVKKKLIEQMTPMDDVMFACLFRDNIEAMNTVVRVCLGDDTISLTKLVIKDEVSIPGFHNVIFDARAVDGQGRQFDVEIQNDSRGALPQRARYYSSILDAYALEPGRDYKDLRPSCVIFMMRRDYWKTGAERMVFEMFDREHGVFLNDGRKIVYMNGEATGDSPIAKLMHDFRCSRGEDMYYNSIGRRAIELRSTAEEDMTVDMEIQRLVRHYFKDDIKREAKKEAEKEVKKELEKEVKKEVEKEVAKLAEGVREEARAEGKNEATIDYAMKMKQENLPVDLISRITGLNSEQIARL